MAEQKTKPRSASVGGFIDSVADSAMREDCRQVLAMMKKITKTEPQMWGSSLIGFGKYHYKYASGHEGDGFLAGFSPRKAALTLYITSGVERHPELMKKLGKFKTGKGCLYLKSLSDVDVNVLEQLIADSVAHTKRTYG